MIAALYIMGAVAMIISVIAGLFFGSFPGLLISIAGGISSAIVFFALAKILENQENILHKLNGQEEINKKFFVQEKRTCSKCDYQYSKDYSSCPNCGHRD